MNRLTDAHLRTLGRSWSTLRLTVEAPDRFPSWDWVVLTAAGEAQAGLFQLALEEARNRGVLSARTRTLVAPDPGGRRIGSGGATLNALREIGAADPEAGRRRILLIHSGGDSRRLPWAALFGKAFLPLPLLADPDRAVPTLLDHLLALAAPLAFNLPEGGLLTMAGDVLPIFDAARVPPPQGDALVITTPVPLDLAGHHGVIVGDEGNRVTRLLQKASPAELSEAGALVERGSALLDTGLWCFAGDTHRRLLSVACARPGVLETLAASGEMCSLYEDLGAALVPAGRAPAAGRPWTAPLRDGMSGSILRHHRADEMVFLHFGSTPEVLDHLERPWFGAMARRILAEDGPTASPEAMLLESTLHHDARVGEGSLVYGCRIGEGSGIGRRCVVAGVDDGGETLRLPDNLCLWQVPLPPAGDGSPRVVFLCCGVDDDPDADSPTATFCNRDFARWRADHGVEPADLWLPGEAPVLWNARLFPVQTAPASLQSTDWLMGEGGAGSERRRAGWLAAPRMRLADLQGSAGFAAWLRRQDEVRGELILRALNRAAAGRLDRNVHALAAQLKAEGLKQRAISLADRYPPAGAGEAGASASRVLQMQSDLLTAGGAGGPAREAAAAAFRAVQDEVSRAVKYTEPVPVGGRPPQRVEVELPVRFDISGGWSDTPPYCLERPARVLNFAMTLNGDRPIKVSAETLDAPEWDLEMADLGAQRVFREPAEALDNSDLSDPFTLAKTALRVCGYGSPAGLSQGIRLRTRAAVPKGSGLGTSSILGAAVIVALQRLAGRPDDTRTVSDLVLVLEQQMRTGGGWQDQVGGLVPGVKSIDSRPVRPLQMAIQPVPLLPAVAAEFESRFVVAFTGQQRLARNILQIVVERYLRRDARTLAAIRGLVELADDGRAALAMGRLDELGRVLGDAWQVLQQLTPECSNPHIDALFRSVEDFALGGKLAGAGGGGFMGVMAKDPEAAQRLAQRLGEFDPSIRVYRWALG